MPKTPCRVAFALFLGASVWTVLIPPEARAGIDFQAATALPVPARPLHMVSGDLNQDGLTDLVVVSPASKTLAVYLAADSGAHFAPAVSYPLDSDNVQGPALGDLNRDGVLDVAVPVLTEGRIRLFLGRGDGTLTRSFPDADNFSNPTSVAIANVVASGDLLVTQRGGGVVMAASNYSSPPPSPTPGAERVLFLAPSHPCAGGGRCDTGPRPDRIWLLDLNKDGKSDFVTLDVGGGRVKSVSVGIYRKENGRYFQALRQYLFGENPESLIIVDVNEDGVPDLVGITQDVGAATSKITTVRGNADGTLAPPTSFTVNCPFFVGSASCRALALASGDFNGDGDVDLAVALNDPRADSSAQAQDALLVLVGRGNGQFDPGPVLPIGKGVLGLAAGDIGGDTLADVAVASTRVMSVQAFINRSTTGDLGNGEQCSFGDECASSRCIDDVCCASSCAEGERCDVPGREGVCQPIPVDPMTCEAADECESTFCVNGYCCDRACVGGRCDVAGLEGICVPGFSNGETCEDDTQCASMICSDNFVCCNERCEGGYCDERGICRPLLDLGDQCNLDQECASAVCDVFNGICCADRCDPISEDCNPDGQCVSLEDTPNVQTPTPTPTRRSTPAPTGDLCSVDSECLSGNCVNDVCCAVSECGADEHCAEGTGQCVAGGTPTRTRTQTPLPTIPEVNPCDPNPCPSGQKCIVGTGGEAVCVSTSSSSGCSTTGSAGSGNLLVVAAMPLLLWLGRRWQLQHAVARARRRR